MKYSVAAIIAFAAATAVATPTGTGAIKGRSDGCTFGTYACTPDGLNVEVCDIEGNWQVADCPDGTTCEYLPDSNGTLLPYCTAVASSSKAKAKRDYGWCSTPGQYTCDGDTAIKVCNVANAFEKVGDCPYDSHCAYIGSIPYCVDGY